MLVLACAGINADRETNKQNALTMHWHIQCIVCNKGTPRIWIVCCCLTTLPQCSNCRGVGGLNPLPHLADSPTFGQNSTLGDGVSTPHLSFAADGMMLDSHLK